MEKLTKNKEKILFLMWGISLIILSLFFILKLIFNEHFQYNYGSNRIVGISISIVLGIKLTLRSINFKKYKHIISAIISLIFLI